MKVNYRMRQPRCIECKSILDPEPYTYYDNDDGTGTMTRYSTEYDLYCNKCDIYYHSLYFPRWKDGEYIRNSRGRGQGMDIQVIEPTPEQRKMVKELDSNRISSIIPDKEFHDYFCKVMKEESDRDCKCYKTEQERKLDHFT